MYAYIVVHNCGSILAHSTRKPAAQMWMIIYIQNIISRPY